MHEDEVALAVRIRVIRLDQYRPQIPDLTRTLSPAEQEQSKRFRLREDAERFLIGRGVIRQLLAVQTGVPPELITLLTTPSGKPYLDPAQSFNARRNDFNLSHSGGYLLLAWSQVGPVGVDIEAVNIRSRETLLAMAERAFSPEELAIVRSASPASLVQIFYRIWVRKEALVKAEGDGIGGPMQSFSVVAASGQKLRWLVQVTLPARGSSWSLSELQVSPGYFACVAYPQGARLEETDDWKA